MSRSLARAGLVGGLLAAATFVFGLAFYGTQLIDFMEADTSEEAVAFLVDHQVELLAGNIVIHLVFGIALVPLALALRDRLGSGLLSRAAAVFGLMWSTVIIATGMITNISYQHVVALHEADPARAAAAWDSLSAVIDGLGGGNELVGGMWILLAAFAGYATRAVPRWVSDLGLGVGLAGLATVAPGIDWMGAVFGLSAIVWFVGAGIAAARGSRRAAAADEAQRESVAA